MYNSFRLLPTLYRRSLYNLVCGLVVIPLVYHFHQSVLPRLLLQSPVKAQPENWEFVTVIILTSVANIIPCSLSLSTLTIDCSHPGCSAPSILMTLLCLPRKKYVRQFHTISPSSTSITLFVEESFGTLCWMIFHLCQSIIGPGYGRRGTCSQNTSAHSGN